MLAEVVTECPIALAETRDAIVTLGGIIRMFTDAPEPEMSHDNIGAAYDIERTRACVGLTRDLAALASVGQEHRVKPCGQTCVAPIPMEVFDAVLPVAVNPTLGDLRRGGRCVGTNEFESLDHQPVVRADRRRELWLPS